MTCTGAINSPNSEVACKNYHLSCNKLGNHLSFLVTRTFRHEEDILHLLRASCRRKCGRRYRNLTLPTQRKQPGNTQRFLSSASGTSGELPRFHALFSNFSTDITSMPIFLHSSGLEVHRTSLFFVGHDFGAVFHLVEQQAIRTKSCQAFFLRRHQLKCYEIELPLIQTRTEWILVQIYSHHFHTNFGFQTNQSCAASAIFMSISLFGFAYRFAVICVWFLCMTFLWSEQNWWDVSEKVSPSSGILHNVQA